MNYNSTKNQDIKGKLVARDVFSCVTAMVNDLIKANSENSEIGFDLFEYLEPFAQYEDEDLYQSDIDEKLEKLRQKVEILENSDEDNEEEIKKIEETIEEIEALELDEYPEVYEYYIVDNYFAKQLKARGEIIIDEYPHAIWGRCATGQAILLDLVVSKVAEDMEILEGQSNEWK